MRFFDALAWFAVVACTLRIVFVGLELKRTQHLVTYLMIQPAAYAAQAKAMIVLCIALLWLVFG